MVCKNCGCDKAVKDGVVNGKQRYKCSKCGCAFREGDNRTNGKIAAKKALAVLFYALSKASFRGLGKLLDVDHTLIYRWVRAYGEGLPEPEVPGDIKEMEFDEMWHFIGSKKTSCGSSKRLTVADGELWPGCSATVIVQLSGDCTTK